MRAFIETLLDNLPYVAIVTVLFYAAAFVCVGREVMRGRTAQGSIGWILALLFFPFVTVFLYFAFGWKSFDDFASAEQRTARARRAIVANHPATDRIATKAWPVLARIAGLPFLGGNRTTLLIDGGETYAAVFEALEGAKHSILLQVYILRDDGLGNEIARRLIERAAAGVAVFVLYDDIGSNKLSKAYLRRLRTAGVTIAGFNERHKPIRLLGPMQLNYRNHRKTIVVDGSIAFVGGHNIGDEYLGLSARFGHWRDTHVRVEGPAAMGCVLSFAEDWDWATGAPLPLSLVEPAPAGNEPVLVMPTGPADTDEHCAIAFVDAIARAERRLWIASPYFVPDLDMVTALIAARLRGVDVRVLLPDKPDHKLVWLAGLSHADDLVNRGIAVLRYASGFMHQKVMLIDDRLAAVGTVNFDNRSFRINFETTLWFAGDDFIAAVARMLEADFEKTVRVTHETLNRRPFPLRLAARGARLLSPIL